MDPFNMAHATIELKIGKTDVSVRCKNEHILADITTTGAGAEILEKARNFGKGRKDNIQ